MADRLLVTGSSGLVGSEVAEFFCALRWEVHGIDNHMRADFFGPAGDSSHNRYRLEQCYPRFTHYDIDIRNREAVFACVNAIRPDLIVHAAAQPSHDLAATRPLDDFDVNATGTLNILEAARRYAKQAPFVFLSTNKVYGDGPNRLAMKEMARRWECADQRYVDGISEVFSTDQCLHSVFGASKLAADVMVQEYGRYFDMPTCSIRAGCITGGAHSGVELHGFLSYLVRCHATDTLYRIYGYGGKQVRDNIHARDIATFILAFRDGPRSGEVYNLGGGRANSCSILEALDALESMTGRASKYEFVPEPRRGDHIWYISDLGKANRDYGWSVSCGLDSMFEEILSGWRHRLAHHGVEQ